MAWRREEEEEVDEERDEYEYKDQKDAVIFAIDVSSSMLKPPPASDSKKADTDTAVSAALKCAYQIMQQRIISQPKDMMGILFFGTKKSKFREDTAVARAGDARYPYCYLFQDLDVPAAEDVRALKDLAEEGEDPDGVLEASDEPVNMYDVFFCANQVFTSNSPNFGSRRLFLITDDDNPNADDKAARSSAAVRAKDLYDLGVIIELFPISRGEQKFDISKFYQDIIYLDPSAESNDSGAVKDSKSGDGLSLLNSLISNVNSKQTPKRAYFSNLSFEIAPGLMTSVNGYITLNRQKPARSCYIWLDGEKPQIAKSETRRYYESGENQIPREIKKSDGKGQPQIEVKKAYKFGGEYVHFTKEESASLKDWKFKGLRIIGFKPRSMLPVWASVKKSMFIFPSEVDYVGSTRVFSALWKKLLADNKMAIAWFIGRSNATPLLVAILPSASRDDDDSSTPFLPAGLWLYPLPFADDIRDPEKKETKQASAELIDQMRPVVQNLALPKGMYDPMRYPNPALQWHYRVLQLLALDEEVPDKPDADPTKPNTKAIAKRVSGYLEEFNEMVGKEAQTLQSSRAIKRDAEEDDDDDARPAKKAKAAPAAKKGAGNGVKMDTAKLKVAAKQGTLGKMTVAELKEVLTLRNLSISGKKAELVERVEQWVEENS